MSKEYRNIPIPVPDGLLDKPRSLKFDVNAHGDFNEESGMELLEVVESLRPRVVTHEDGSIETLSPEYPQIRVIRALIWAGLRHEDERLTVRTVGAMLSLDIFRHMAKEIGMALRQYLPHAVEQEAEEEEVPQKVQSKKRTPLTGPGSSVSPSATSE